MSNEIKISKKTIWIVVITLVVIGLFFFIRNGGNLSTGNIVMSGQIGSQVGDIAPSFPLQTIDGENIFSEKFKGKKIVIGFFATWCTPCQIEAANVKQVDDETGGDKFIVYQIGVDPKESSQQLQTFKSIFGNNDWILGIGMDVAREYNVKSLDTTFILDEEGNII